MNDSTVRNACSSSRSRRAKVPCNSALIILVRLLASVSMCFKPSPPQRMIISGQREISIKRYTVERTNEAEIRPEEQSDEKAESCRDNIWSEIQLKGP